MEEPKLGIGTILFVIGLITIPIGFAAWLCVNFGFIFTGTYIPEYLLYSLIPLYISLGIGPLMCWVIVPIVILLRRRHEVHRHLSAGLGLDIFTH